MLGVGGFNLSLGRAGEGGGGSRGGGHLSRRMLLLERPFLPRFLHIRDAENVFSGQQTEAQSHLLFCFRSCTSLSAPLTVHLNE